MDCLYTGCLASIYGGPEKVMRQLGDDRGWRTTPGHARCPKHVAEKEKQKVAPASPSSSKAP
jgi:hypothetical protein